jgi:hypothetical protein
MPLRRNIKLPPIAQARQLERHGSTLAARANALRIANATTRSSGVSAMVD